MKTRLPQYDKYSEEDHYPVYRRHEALLEQLLKPLTESQRSSLESMMKAIGKNTETLGEMPKEL
jgi:hypothetical protein